MNVTPYLFFRGNCREAMRHYAKVLGAAEPEFMSFADMPEEDKAAMPGVPGDAVMNCMLEHEGGVIMGSDDPSPDAAPMAGVSLHLGFKTPQEAHRVFAALAEGGSVTMPIGETFWSPAFGSVHDKFGTRWMVSGGGEGDGRTE